MGATRPSLDYLLMSSQMSLESVELARLNRAANLRKEMQQVLEEWIDVEVDARLARSILEWRRAGNPAAQTSLERDSPGKAPQLEASFLSSRASAADEPPSVPTAQLPDRVVNCPKAAAAQGGIHAGRFPASRARVLWANGGEPLPENAACEIHAIGPLAPRRSSPARSVHTALLLAEHRTYGDSKVHRGILAAGNGEAGEKRPLCRTGPAIELARRATIAACDPRPATPARRLLRCAAAFARRVAAAS